MKEQITLCEPCRGDYTHAGIRLEHDRAVTIKDACEICDRPGWTYLIERGTDHANKTM